MKKFITFGLVILFICGVGESAQREGSTEKAEIVMTICSSLLVSIYLFIILLEGLGSGLVNIAIISGCCLCCPWIPCMYLLANFLACLWCILCGIPVGIGGAICIVVLGALQGIWFFLLIFCYSLSLKILRFIPVMFGNILREFARCIGVEESISSSIEAIESFCNRIVDLLPESLPIFL